MHEGSHPPPSSLFLHCAAPHISAQAVVVVVVVGVIVVVVVVVVFVKTVRKRISLYK